MHSKEEQTVVAVGDVSSRARRHFVSELPVRVRAIVTELSRVAGGEGGLTDLERLFHTIAGTGSTFGLVAVASLAREAEEICSGHSLDDERAAYLRMVAADLENQVAALSAQAA